MSFWWNLLFLNELENISNELEKSNAMKLAELNRSPNKEPPRVRYNPTIDGDIVWRRYLDQINTKRPTSTD